MCILQPFEEPPDPNKTRELEHRARLRHLQRPNAIKLDWRHEIHTGLVWLRDNLCLLVVSCLEDEKSLAVSIGEIIRSIKNVSSRNGSIFGVVFSLTHCSVVRLEVGGEGITVTAVVKKVVVVLYFFCI